MIKMGFGILPNLETVHVIPELGKDVHVDESLVMQRQSMSCRWIPSDAAAVHVILGELGEDVHVDGSLATQW